MAEAGHLKDRRNKIRVTKTKTRLKPKRTEQKSKQKQRNQRKNMNERRVNRITEEELEATVKKARQEGARERIRKQQ